MYVPLAGKGDVNVWLPRNMANQKLRGEIVYQWPLKPPLKKGRPGGRCCGSRHRPNAVNEVPLYAAEDVEPGGTVRRGSTSLLYDLALRQVGL